MFKVKFFLIFLFIIFIAALFSIFIGANSDGIYEVKPIIFEENNSTFYIFTFIRSNTGKNLLVIPFDPHMDAKTFLLTMPEIDAITSLEDGWGYIRAFGGIGNNFPIESNRSYEVSVNRQVNFTLKV